jgi:dihydroorotate dehydrogenase
MIDAYPLIRPLLMRMDAEDAHRLALRLLGTGLGPRCAAAHPALETTVFGVKFPNPLGLAAGFDKDAEALGPLLAMGFGFVEAGTVTPLPQAGNPRPRVFRDLSSESVINRMGFPGKGLDVFEKNFSDFRQKNPGRIAGANIGINKDTPDALAAYRTGLARVAPLSDYVTVNVSSPNTAGLRDLQAREALDNLLGGLMSPVPPKPLLLKVAPDLTIEQKADIAELALKHRIAGLIVSNTTVSRPDALAAALREEKGGLSGRLLRDLSTAAIRDFRRLTNGALPIVGVGGMSSAEDVYEKIRAGASLVQIYTGLVFQGPALVRRILEGLPLLLVRDGFKTVTEAVGAAV